MVRRLRRIGAIPSVGRCTRSGRWVCVLRSSGATHPPVRCAAAAHMACTVRSGRARRLATRCAASGHPVRHIRPAGAGGPVGWFPRSGRPVQPLRPDGAVLPARRCAPSGAAVTASRQQVRGTPPAGATRATTSARRHARAFQMTASVLLRPAAAGPSRIGAALLYIVAEARNSECQCDRGPPAISAFRILQVSSDYMGESQHHFSAALTLFPQPR